MNLVRKMFCMTTEYHTSFIAARIKLWKYSYASSYDFDDKTTTDMAMKL